MMLSIKAICKSENNEEVVIIGFELEGYCLCMTKSGTIFHAKHDDLTIVDKEYMEACAKESIYFEMADFLEKASSRLDQIQSKQLTRIILELQEYRSKIEQGKMIELPCKVGDMIYWTSSNNRDIIEAVVEKISFTKYDRVILLVAEKGVGEYSIPLVWDIFLTREEAEKRLLELQGDKE